ncbi:hypothetical protein C4B63_134g72 [Trypanosoma cruzi]|uniref:Xrn1 N-terminal domain-containing protein n=1 Tax=Trypanosoma cruzi TaxID=5693 RepID=A0A2V2UPQ1_TRYCR|nr:hypothetical protein C4B63_134g72 [Trypanosoma cruzi]
MHRWPRTVREAPNATTSKAAVGAARHGQCAAVDITCRDARLPLSCGVGERLAAQFKLRGGRGFLPHFVPVFLHGSTVAGEGEAKIARALAHVATASLSRGERYNPNHTVVVIGNDIDLTLTCLGRRSTTISSSWALLRCSSSVFPRCCTGGCVAGHKEPGSFG